MQPMPLQNNERVIQQIKTKCRWLNVNIDPFSHDFFAEDI